MILKLRDGSILEESPEESGVAESGVGGLLDLYSKVKE